MSFLSSAVGRLLSASPSATSTLAFRPLHTSPPIANKGARAHKKVRTPSKLMMKIRAHGKRNAPPVVMPTAPLAATFHPKSRFHSHEEQVLEEVKKQSEPDMPLCDIADPYTKERPKCVLCPRRYDSSVSIRPSWKNPKMLAQFVSPHTGLVYQKHITGLCQFMQDEVELEVRRAQAFGYLATKMREPYYAKDPKLFEPSRPTRKNPL